MTSVTHIDVGCDGSWTRLEEGCPSEGGDDSKNGKYEIASREDAEEYNQDTCRTGRNDMEKDENKNSSEEDNRDEDESDHLDQEEDKDYRVQASYERNSSSVAINESNNENAEHRIQNATPTTKSTHDLKLSCQTYEQLHECESDPKESEISTCQEKNSNHQITEVPPFEQQNMQQPEIKMTHSSKQIPKSHQTLKMRLKLRAPVITNDVEEVEEEAAKEKIVKRRGRRKQGCQTLPVKKDIKKFAQISLGNQATRWQEVKNMSKGLKFHSQVAKLLLDCFDALLDGSLQWSSNSAHADLKSRLTKMFADNNLRIPNDSWSPVAKRKRNSVMLSPPKKVIYKQDSEEEDEDDDDAEEENMEEEDLEAQSTDEDYLPVTSIQKTRKRLQPKRRKQTTPRRVVMTASQTKNENKKVQPLKVMLSKNNTKDIKAEVIPDEVTKEVSGKRRRRRSSGRRNSDVQETPKLPPIPPEFATYPKVFKCRRCPPKSEDTYSTFQLLQEHFDTHKQDRVPPKKKYAPNLPPLSPDGEETEEQAIQRMAKVLICCPDCKKLFFPGRLVQHLKTAHVRVLCDECGGMFSRVAMWEHKKAHRFKAQGKKPYKCDKCDKEFLWQVSLRQHRELHSRERPFICSACGKSFKTLTKMKRHEIIHEAVKPYTCPHCRRSFTQRTNLKTHMRTHTGEKPYKCEYCAKTFTHKVSMKTHMKKEHGVDLWRDGPSHRVQEFDDVKCQMKRRKNPQTKSIQNILSSDTGISTGITQGQDTVSSAFQRTSARDSVKNIGSEELQDFHHDEQRNFEERHYEQRIPVEGQERLLEEQRLVEDRRMVSDDHGRLDTRSQGVAGSPQEMVEIALSERHHVKTIGAPGVNHQKGEQQMQNCISPTKPPQHETVQIPLGEGSQPSHDIHRGGLTTTTQATHYTPHYLPVSADVPHLSHHMSSSSNTNHSRYSTSSQEAAGTTSGYPPMSALHPNIRQGPTHRSNQQGSAMHHPPVAHPRYSSWALPQAGELQGYSPGSEMSPAVLSELMKLGK